VKLSQTRRCKMRGVAFQAFFSFALLISAWALLDLVVYVGLRAFHLRFRACSEVFGSLCLAPFFLGWVALFLFAGATFSGSGSFSQESTLAFFGAFFGGMTLSATPGLGGLLVRRAMRKELIWWHGVLFFAFYFVAAHLGEIWVYNTYSRSINPFLRPIDSFFSSFGSGPIGWFIGVCGGLLVWSFPMIAPLLEIAIYPFWRAYQQHRSGTYE
jgi:hypothetical protein